MAITGKSSLSLKKQDLVNEKSIALGFQDFVFAHKCAGSETGIDLTALTIPTEMSSAGFSNPSTAQIAGANLKFYRRNLKLTSSARPGVLIDYLSYDVPTSTRINFKGFTALPGEIFVGYLGDSPKTGLNVVDSRPIIVTSPLLAGTTDFNVGIPFAINANPLAQIGSVLVFKDGIQQFRNTNNATASPSADGNYQEVDPGGGLGVIIRFNISDSADHNILVFNAGLAERPDGSMMAVVEGLAGQLDSMRPVVEALSGLPLPPYAPNSVDLKAFGDEVQNHENRIDVLEQPAPYMWVSNLALTTISSGNPFVFDTVESDVLGMYNTGTGMVTIPKAGKWVAHVKVTLSTTVTMAATDTFVVSIRQNGQDKAQGLFTKQVGGAGENHQVDVPKTLICQAGDQVQILVFNGFGGFISANVNVYNYFDLVWVGY